MAQATTDEWGKYYRAAEERRSLEGGDPLRRYLQRYILRERCFFVGSSLLLMGLVTTFCVVLMR